MLSAQAGRREIIAEPGRILVAEAMTLVTSVVGVADRGDGRWYYLDDGVYGSYSNVVAEDVHPLVFAVSGLAEPASRRERRPVTLGGPTCDSGDVIARGVLLPELAVGDLLASPAMGAYTAVTATGFNGLPLASVVAVAAGSASVAIAKPAEAEPAAAEPAVAEPAETEPAAA
ncbi:hypothetical protein [Microbacterium hominis]|uniref:hypothetical protein n=1 Tax=Microbacterium hominis TaxID=162426 RepID=UPI0020B815A7|nr:hypothetical protein [Microbacterium hominis]